MTQGILYIATGKRHIAEAVRSGRSAKIQMEGVTTAILCDDITLECLKPFDIVQQLNNPTYSVWDKIVGLLRTPFDNTLFLDTDTLVIEPVYELFELLDRFDLAAAHAPWRWTSHTHACPDCFPEFNSGVVLFHNCDHVRCFVSRWEAIYRAQWAVVQRPLQDQPAFRQALYESNLRFTVLPPEYNLRTIFAFFAGGNARVKILHGRGECLHQIAGSINKRLVPRVFHPSQFARGSKRNPA